MVSSSAFRLASAGACIALLAIASFGEPDSTGIQTRIFGFGSYEFGQIVKGQYAYSPANGKLAHYWTQKGLLQIGADMRRDDGWRVMLAGEGMVSFPYARPSDGSSGGYTIFQPRYSWYFHQAEAMYSVGNPKAPLLQIGTGFFPFKYNRDGRNFGDYLFRLSTYPQYMPTNFDTPYQRLLGLHLNSALYPFASHELLGIRQDLLLTSEIHLWPLKDFSLTYIVDCSVLKFAEIGAGIKGDRIFPVDDSITTPPGASNPNGFTFKGTKVMVKLSLDFKRFLPLKELWGSNDLRLYSEACFNGLKNYEVVDTADPLYPGYSDIKNRLPIVIGFNVPTCKILDVLSVEAEWWDNNFANSYRGVYKSNDPLLPDPIEYGPSGSLHSDPYGGDWHWSVYLKKSIAKNICFMAQASRDHTIIETALYAIGNTGDPQEALDGKGNWMWMCKMEYGF